MKPKTEAQETALRVLRDLGGWHTHWQLVNHGASSVAATALTKIGLAEQRFIKAYNGKLMPEWRAVRNKKSTAPSAT